MKYIQKSIEEASPAELRAFANTFLGIPVDDFDSDATVLAKINAAHEGPIFVAEAPEEVETGAPPPSVPGVEKPVQVLVGGLGRNDPKVRLTLHAEERDGVVNSRHKEVGVNGVVFLIKRGISVDVPYRVYLALKDAVRNNITHDGEGEVLEQVAHNTPFNVERMPSAEEIEAWHVRTRDAFCPA